MPKITELIDSLTDDNVSDVLETIKSEALALEEKNSQLYQRAKKAEGFDYDKNAKQWIKKEKSEPPRTVKSSEPDYARLAFLETKGISHPDDQKVIQDEAERLSLPLTDVLAMKHIKSQLEANKDQRDALAGMPKGKGRSGGTTQHDIDYWIDKQKPDGTYDTPEDHELAVKVINARIKKQGSVNQFSDILYTG
jgi:hypothetical protein